MAGKLAPAQKKLASASLKLFERLGDLLLHDQREHAIRPDIRLGHKKWGLFSKQSPYPDP